MCTRLVIDIKNVMFTIYNVYKPTHISRIPMGQFNEILHENLIIVYILYILMYNIHYIYT